MRELDDLYNNETRIWPDRPEKMDKRSRAPQVGLKALNTGGRFSPKWKRQLRRHKAKRNEK